jgi:hypothetical protein
MMANPATMAQVAPSRRPAGRTSGKPASRPADAAASSTPTATGPALKVSVARNGRMRSSGAEKSTTTQKPRAMARTDGVRQMYASPSRASRATEGRVLARVSRGGAGRRRASGTTTRNVRASRPSTSRAPDTANSNPASGGPSTAASSRTPLRKALAARSSSATTAGMHRPTAADSGVSARASAKTTASRAPSGGSSSATSPARTAWASQPAPSRRPGGNRSATTPANGAASGGMACANSSSPTAVALPVVRCTCRIKAVVAIASPSGLMA